MSKTDRQTDKPSDIDGKSSCWLTTAYNDDIGILEDVSTYPDYVKEVLGGREMCPDTGRLHFQGAIILHSQQRFSALKKWLPTAWLGVAKSRDAVKKYAMKKETAVGEKTVRENTIPYLDMERKLMIMAEAVHSLRPEDMDQLIDARIADPKDGEFWWLLTNKVLPKYSGKIINAFAYPEVRTIWRNTEKFWTSQPPVSITQAADNVGVLEN